MELCWGLNPSTGNGYGINFYNNGCANSGSEINFVSYSDGTPTTITTTTLSSSTTICACPCYVQVIITGSCQYMVSLSNSATGPFTPLATYTGGSCSGGYMGFMAYNSTPSFLPILPIYRYLYHPYTHR